MNLKLINLSLMELKAFTIGVSFNERDAISRDIYDTIIGKICQIIAQINEPDIKSEEIKEDAKENEEPFLKSEKFRKILKVKETSLEDILNEIPEGRFNLRQKIKNALLANGIDTLEKLIETKCKTLLYTPNFGRRSLDKLLEALETHGYKLNV